MLYGAYNSGYDATITYREKQMSEVKQVFAVDGKIFESKAEAIAYEHRPKVLNALSEVTDGNEELSAWLVDNQELVESAFEVGTVRRVKASEKKKLASALAAVAAADIAGTEFLTENSEQILTSYRWPPVRRMNDEEKATAARNTLIASTKNEGLSTWIVDNQELIKSAYAEGKPRRAVNPNAIAALKKYQEEQRRQEAGA